MHSAEIKAALAKAGTSQRQIAADVGVKESVVSAVLNGRARSQRVEERISSETDIPLYRLWPQWHAAPEGAPKDFDPTRLNLGLLEAVERSLATELQQRVAGLKMPFLIRGELRVDVYNACLDRGTAAIETGAGTADEAAKYLDAWVLRYQQTTMSPPTPEAWRKWALVWAVGDDGLAARPTITAIGNNQVAGRDIHNSGNRPKRER